jgi:hypothetical protein
VLEIWSGSRLSLAISSTDYPERVSLLQREIYGLWQEVQCLLILSAGRLRRLLDLILSLTVVQVSPYRRSQNPGICISYGIEGLDLRSSHRDGSSKVKSFSTGGRSQHR